MEIPLTGLPATGPSSFLSSRVATFQITPLDRECGTCTVVEPPRPRRVMLGDVEALETRRRVDALIAARLAMGRVTVDLHAADAQCVAGRDVCRPRSEQGRPPRDDLALRHANVTMPPAARRHATV